MRILHTADWHAGKMLRNRSRSDEQERVFAEIIDIARRERVDLLLIAGDIFESFAPSPDAERLVYSALAELIGSKITTVVLGGNHDHPKRLAALRELLAPLSIFVRAEPQRPEAGGVIEINVGNEVARVAVLPWVQEYKLVDICQLLMGLEDTWYSTYSENVAGMLQRLAQSFSSSTINLLAAHLYAFGAEASGSEKAVHVSHPFAIDPARFPVTAQYVALGHLHRPQEVACPTRCRYAGSPLQLDFGEREQQKSVVIVDVHPGTPATIQTLPLSSGRKLRDLSGTLEELRKMGGSIGDDFLRVTVKTDERVPGLADQIRELFPNALDVTQDYPHVDEVVVETGSAKQPHEIFCNFYQQTRGCAPPPEMIETFQTLYREATRAAD